MSSFLNQRPPTSILIAQAVGITASTFLVGQNAAMSYAFMPAILKAPAPLAVEQWKDVFDTGRRIGPLLAIIGSGCFAYVAYNQDRSSLPFKFNVAAAGILPSIIPFTFAFIGSTNAKLDQKLEDFASIPLEDRTAEKGVKKEETTHVLLDRWATLNLARAGIIAVASVLSIWAAVDGREAFSFGKIALSSGANRM